VPSWERRALQSPPVALRFRQPPETRIAPCGATSGVEAVPARRVTSRAAPPASPRERDGCGSAGSEAESGEARSWRSGCALSSAPTQPMEGSSDNVAPLSTVRAGSPVGAPRPDAKDARAVRLRTIPHGGGLSAGGRPPQQRTLRVDGGPRRALRWLSAGMESSRRRRERTRRRIRRRTTLRTAAKVGTIFPVRALEARRTQDCAQPRHSLDR
jgi:hypothetical protein